MEQILACFGNQAVAGRKGSSLNEKQPKREEKKEIEIKQSAIVCKMGISKLQTKFKNGVKDWRVIKELYSFLKKLKEVTCQQHVAGRLAETLTK